MGRLTNRKQRRPQPLNVEVGKREADAIYRRRDRTEARRILFNRIPQPERTEFDRWLDEQEFDRESSV